MPLVLVTSFVTCLFVIMGFCILKDKKISFKEGAVLLITLVCFWIIGYIFRDIFINLCSIPIVLFLYNYFHDKTVKIIPNIVYSISTLIIFLVSDIISNLISNVLRKSILRDYRWVSLTIYFLCACAGILILSNIFGKIIKDFSKTKINDNSKKVNKVRLIYVYANIFICGVMIIGSFIINKMVVKADENYLINLVIFLFSILSAVFSANMYNKYSVKEMEIKRKNEEIQRMEEYAGYMEELYTNIRQFKHDYKNILMSMEGYIDSGDYDGLETYFRDSILPTQHYMEKNDFFVKLKNIKILPFKSIIISKLMKAQSNGCNLFIDISEPVDKIPMEYIDCMRVFGILLDNAIEEAQKTINKNLNFGIIKKDNSMVFVVQNSCVKRVDEIYKLTQKGYSTKENGRGIGLYNLKKIVNEYDNITFNLECSEDMFTAEIWMRTNISEKIDKKIV